jgi:hypothetical protein
MRERDPARGGAVWQVFAMGRGATVNSFCPPALSTISVHLCQRPIRAKAPSMVGTGLVSRRPRARSPRGHVLGGFGRDMPRTGEFTGSASWCWRSVALLRQILAEFNHDHDRRADCHRHRADKRQFFHEADNGRPNADSSFQLREAQACHTHRTSPFGPQQAAG